MKVLVTGGAGFIGSHVVDGLLAQGSDVIVLDNLSSGRRGNLPDDQRLRFIEGDIRDAKQIHKLVVGCGAVMHLAAVASVPASIEDPVGTHETNFNGTLNVLEAARRHGCPRVVYASSAAVYGEAAELPAREDAIPHPLSPYAADKLAGEYYLAFYARQFGLPGVAFRFFNIYGPRQDPRSPYSGVISIFAERARRNEAVSVHGDGQQTRDFVYVADLAALLVDTVLNSRELAGEVINVGRGTECSLLALLAGMEAAMGRVIERKFTAVRSGDIRRSCADTTRLRRFAGQIPKTGLEDGLRALLQSSSR